MNGISSIDTDMLCQHYLNILYHNISGHKVNERQNKNIPETYGEILYASVDKLLAELSLSDQDIFVDLGSGLGKVVIQTFLNSAVKESHGIEIIPELHQESLIAAQKVQNDLPDFFEGERRLTFLKGSFLGIPLDMASVVLIGSPCFSPQILEQLGEIINNVPSIHTVLTLRPISTLKRLSFTKVIRVECSWDTALCYVYKCHAHHSRESENFISKF